MRLLQSEYSKIAQVLEKHDRGEQYLLVKKRGWIHIKIDKKAFSFHRKSTSELIEGIFVKRSQYYIRTNGPAVAMDDFVGVLTALSEWISRLDKMT